MGVFLLVKNISMGLPDFATDVARLGRGGNAYAESIRLDAMLVIVTERHDPAGHDVSAASGNADGLLVGFLLGKASGDCIKCHDNLAPWADG